MKTSKGIVRKLDELGRITIPSEIRKNLGMGERAEIDMYMDNGRICMEKYEQSYLNEVLEQVPDSKKDKLAEVVKKFLEEEC